MISGVERRNLLDKDKNVPQYASRRKKKDVKSLPRPPKKPSLTTENDVKGGANRKYKISLQVECREILIQASPFHIFWAFGF